MGAPTTRDGDATGIFNSAVPGDAVDTSSITTLSLGVNMNKQLNEVGGAGRSQENSARRARGRMRVHVSLTT